MHQEFGQNEEKAVDDWIAEHDISDPKKRG
jgi:hypothetical protein